MKKVVLFTSHTYDSKKKAGFHFLCEAFVNKGYHATFVTTSRCVAADLFNRDDFQAAKRPKNTLIARSDTLSTYIVYSFFYPFHLRVAWLNRLMIPLFRRYERISLKNLETAVTAADLFLFESCLGLFLLPSVRRHNRRAQIIYRVSDDLRLLKYTPLLFEYEAAMLNTADLISVPCQSIYEKFQGCRNLALHPHGLKKEMFNRPCENPYRLEPFNQSKNFVFVGMSHLDYNFMSLAARLLPEYYFHVIGPFHRKDKPENLIFHGVLDFSQTIPYIKYADIGLQSRSFVPFAESLSDSLKYQQYTYCQLPIIAPDYMRSNKPHVFYYKDNDAGSIKASVESALRFDRNSIPRHEVLSWDEIVDSMIECLYPHEH